MSSLYGSSQMKTFIESTSQYGDFNILIWNCFYQNYWSYILIAQLSKALIDWCTTDPEFEYAGDVLLLKDTEIISWKSFSPPKINMSI